MCGLTGIAVTSNTNSWDSLLELLMFFTQLRGTDSTGLASITKGGDVQTRKEVGSASLWLDNKENTALLKSPAMYKIGHCRSATSGSVDAQSAHPFTFNPITLAHNGTLDYNWRDVLNIHDKTLTDSNALAYSIATLGWEHVLCNMTLQGSWALTWHDARDNTMNFIRDKNRPLFVAHIRPKAVYNSVNSADGFVWASEKWMIAVAVSRIGFDIIQWVDINEGQLWSMSLVDNKLVMSSKKLVTFYTPPAPVWKGWVRQDYHDNYGTEGSRSNNKVVKINRSLVKRWEAFKVPVAINQSISVSFSEFVPLSAKKGSRGKVVGKCNYAPNLAVEVHNVEDVGVDIKEILWLRVVDFRMNKSDNSMVLILSTHGYKEEIEDIKRHQKYLPAPKVEKARYLKGRYIRGPKGVAISEEEFEDLTQNGCTVCLSPLHYDDSVAWIKTSHGDEPVCQDCYDRAKRKS